MNTSETVEWVSKTNSVSEWAPKLKINQLCQHIHSKQVNKQLQKLSESIVTYICEILCLAQLPSIAITYLPPLKWLETSANSWLLRKISYFNTKILKISKHGLSVVLSKSHPQLISWTQANINWACANISLPGRSNGGTGKMKAEFYFPLKNFNQEISA